MSERPRLELAGAGFALLVCIAFIASFAFGLGRPRDAEPALDTELPVIDAPVRAGRVEVLNGSGRSGLARAVTGRLRTAGFDVVYFGNASESARDSTAVIARVPDDAVARAVAEQLGVARVLTEPDSTLYLEATVLIGVDWPQQ